MLPSAEPREFGVPKGPVIPPLRFRMKSSALGADNAWLMLGCVVAADPAFEPPAGRFRELPAGLAERACSNRSGSWSNSTYRKPISNWSREMESYSNIREPLVPW